MVMGGKYMAKKILKEDLGNGFYLEYNEKSNGIGGYHPVNLTLCKEGEVIKKITDKYGYFLDFPGTVEGEWRRKVIGSLEPVMNFVFWASKYQGGLCRISWMVQPDGRYYADEDGFGADDDEEVWLYAYINERGEFVTKFSEKREL